MAELVTPSLDDLAHKYQTDKGTQPVESGLSPKSYTLLYEKLFSPLRDQPIRLLELGVAKGYSLLMWEEYFSEGKIFGIDINPATMLHTDRIQTFCGSQSDLVFLSAIYPDLGSLDIIIDDGGHKREQQSGSFQILWGLLRPGGFYAIEDLQADKQPPDRDPLVSAITTRMFHDKDWPLAFGVEQVWFYPRLIVLQMRH